MSLHDKMSQITYMRAAELQISNDDRRGLSEVLDNAQPSKAPSDDSDQQPYENSEARPQQG